MKNTLERTQSKYQKVPHGMDDPIYTTNLPLIFESEILRCE
jgi:hypothetical protein